MNKTLLIIKREYLSRVQKRSFIIMTILTPVIFAGIYALGIYLAIRPAEEKIIQIVDNSGLFIDKFSNTPSISYEYASLEVDEAKEKVRSGDFSGVLIIPEIDLAKDHITGIEVLGAIIS